MSCPLAIVLCLLGGIVFDASLPATIAAIGAFTVGFGARQSLSEWRVLPMLACLFGIAASSFVGSLIGVSAMLTMAAAALWAVLTGLATARNRSLGWIVLQCTIALIVSASFPGDDFAFKRALWLMIGGSLQVLVFALALLVGWDKAWQPAAPLPAPPTGWLVARYVLIAVLGIVLERLLPISNAYWIPMTALIVARPTAVFSTTIVLQRVIGTLIGAIGASLISRLIAGHADLWAIAAITGCAAVSYACLQVNYGLFSASVTAFISLLLALHGPPEIEIVEFRSIATILGCFLTLVVCLIFARLFYWHARWKTATPAASGTNDTRRNVPAAEKQDVSRLD